MADLTVGRVYLAKRIGYKDGKPLFRIAQPCEVTADVVHLIRHEGYNNSKPIGRIMTVGCDSSGDLMVGQVYPARRIGYRDGKPLYRVVCADCTTVCECCHCCGCDRFTSAGLCCGACHWNPPTQIEVTVSHPCMGTRTITLDIDFSGWPAYDLAGGNGGCQNVTIDAGSLPKFNYYGSYSSTGDINSCGGFTYCDGSITAPGFVQEIETLEITLQCINCSVGDINDCLEYDFDDPPGALDDLCTPVEPTTNSVWLADVVWEKIVGCTGTNVHWSGPVELLQCDPISFTATSPAVACYNELGVPPVDPCDPADRLCDGAGCATSRYDDCLGDTLQFDADEV